MQTRFACVLLWFWLVGVWTGDGPIWWSGIHVFILACHAKPNFQPIHWNQSIGITSSPYHLSTTIFRFLSVIVWKIRIFLFAQSGMTDYLSSIIKYRYQNPRVEFRFGRLISDRVQREMLMIFDTREWILGSRQLHLGTFVYTKIITFLKV